MAGSEEEIVNTFLGCNTQILVCAERTYTRQWPELRHKYDATAGPYRYVGSGAIMGFAGALRRMAQASIHAIEQGCAHANHQSLTGKYVHDHFGDTTHVRLDTECRLFWVIGDDDAPAFVESPLRNPYAQTTPRILRVVGGHRENAELYRQVGERITAAGT